MNDSTPDSEPQGACSDTAPPTATSVTGYGAWHLASQHGLHVFPLLPILNGRCACCRKRPGAPCENAGKHPAIAWGTEATADPDAVRVLWTPKWRGAWDALCGIGIATGPSGLVALDIDPRHGGDSTLSGALAELGLLPPSPTVITGGGGLHHYFRAPAGLRLPSKSDVLGAGLDLKASGGYVVAPPSVHKTGNRYRWADGRSLCTIDPLPELPTAWLAALVSATAPSHNYDDERTEFDAGERNQRLYHLAHTLRKDGVLPELIGEFTRRVNQVQARPPVGRCRSRQNRD